MPINCSAFLTFLSLLLRLHPSGFSFFLFFFKSQKTKQKEFTVLSFHRSDSRDQIFPFLNHINLREISPGQDRSRKSSRLLVLDPPPGPATWGLCSLRSSVLFCGRDGYGAVAPGNCLMGWHHGNLPGLLCEGSPALLLAMSFVVVYIVSKYVIPLRPSYIIYVSPAFRQGGETKLLLDSSLAG